MKVLVVGAGGRLAQRVMQAMTPDHDVLALSRQQLDIRDGAAIRKTLQGFSPKAVINCAAWTAVDAAERYAREALEVNAHAVRVLARECDVAKSMLVHYSTSFVFNGSLNRPYTEHDEPTPQGVYAWSKWAGERMALGDPHPRPRAVYVLRIGPPEYGAAAAGILDSLRIGADPTVTGDLVVSPSFSVDVAWATAQILLKRPPYGLYHVVNNGHCSWRGFALEAASCMQVSPVLQVVRAEDLPTVAPRPRYGVLSNTKLAQAGIQMPSWREALRRDLVGAAA